MDIRVKSYLDRAENQIILAKANFEISINENTKKILGIPIEKTFFNNVISEALLNLGNTKYGTFVAGINFGNGPEQWPYASIYGGYGHAGDGYPGTGGYLQFNTSPGDSQPAIARMVITNSGNVGIGTTNPGSYMLYVSGTIYASGSSLKYKEKIQPIENTEGLYNLIPVSFDYKDEYKHFGKTLGSEKQIGLIAEDVAKYVPELAIYVDGEPRNVDYEKLSVLLLSELKKHNEKIKYLEEQVELLNNKMRSNHENSN